MLVTEKGNQDVAVKTMGFGARYAWYPSLPGPFLLAWASSATSLNFRFFICKTVASIECLNTSAAFILQLGDEREKGKTDERNMRSRHYGQ